MSQRQNKLGFPFHYGDIPVDDERRLSVTLVNGIKSKGFRDLLSGVCSIILIVGSNVTPVNAVPLDGIPVEAGEYIAQAAAEAVGEMPRAVPAAACGKAAGAALAPGPAPLEAGAGHHQSFLHRGGPGQPLGPGGPGGPPGPGQPPIFMGIPRPATMPWRIANTIGFGSSVGWICLNAYWGNPVAIAGCSVMAGTWFLSVLGIRLG